MSAIFGDPADLKEQAVEQVPKMLSRHLSKNKRIHDKETQAEDKPIRRARAAEVHLRTEVAAWSVGEVILWMKNAGLCMMYFFRMVMIGFLI